MFQEPPSKKDAIAALKTIENIQRPEGDNEGEAINSESIYNQLSPEEQDAVDKAVTTLKEYVRKPGDEGDEPNRRAITELNKEGFYTTLGQHQEDPYLLDGHIKGKEWIVDIGDQS